VNRAVLSLSRSDLELLKKACTIASTRCLEFGTPRGLKYAMKYRAMSEHLADVKHDQLPNKARKDAARTTPAAKERQEPH
jgi:hypothetical protein